MAEIRNQSFSPKMGHFGFFQLIKNYAETTFLIDEEYISQEASYTARQNSSRVKSPKIWVNGLKIVFNQRFWVLYNTKHKQKYFLFHRFLEI